MHKACNMHIIFCQCFCSDHVQPTNQQFIFRNITQITMRTLQTTAEGYQRSHMVGLNWKYYSVVTLYLCICIILLLGLRSGMPLGLNKEY